jgi:hypothetical protein
MGLTPWVGGRDRDADAGRRDAPALDRRLEIRSTTETEDSKSAAYTFGSRRLEAPIAGSAVDHLPLASFSAAVVKMSEASPHSVSAAANESAACAARS